MISRGKNIKKIGYTDILSKFIYLENAFMSDLLIYFRHLYCIKSKKVTLIQWFPFHNQLHYMDCYIHQLLGVQIYPILFPETWVYSAKLKRLPLVWYILERVG